MAENGEPISPKARENRARRAAKRQGKVLVKSRKRDPLARGYGKYVLVSSDDLGDLTVDEIAEEMFTMPGVAVSMDTIEALLNWDDIRIGDPEQPLDIANRAVITYYGDQWWQASVSNDGDPMNEEFGVPEDLPDVVMMYTEKFLEATMRVPERNARERLGWKPSEKKKT